MTEHRIEITPSGRKYRAAYQGEPIGEWRVPECDAARWLIAAGRAAPGDRLIVCRYGRPALAGALSWFADRTVIENEKASPRWAKYRAFEMEPQDRPETACGTAQDGQDAVAATNVAKAA